PRATSSPYIVSPTVFSSFFFFYCYGDHRDLHSFPTRRSSDLPLDRLNAFLLAPAAPGRSHLASSQSGSIWVRSTPSIVIPGLVPDRKSTRLNSSHVEISYAVFCLKKKKKKNNKISITQNKLDD